MHCFKQLICFCVEEGSLILLSFICSLIRNTLYPSSKLKALDILFALGERVPDDVKLDRLVPYLMCLLTDESALVRANAIKTLTRIVSKHGFFVCDSYNLYIAVYGRINISH